MSNVIPERGSALVEALVAALIMTTGVLTMAQLFAISLASNAAARRGTVATILAEQKIEQLRAEAAGGSVLPISPASALQENTEGFVDHVGADGRIVGSSAQPPPQATYTRRWSVESVSTAPESALIIQVLVTVRSGAGVSRAYAEARVATVKARSAP